MFQQVTVAKPLLSGYIIYTMLTAGLMLQEQPAVKRMPTHGNNNETGFELWALSDSLFVMYAISLEAV